MLIPDCEELEIILGDSYLNMFRESRGVTINQAEIEEIKKLEAAIADVTEQLKKYENSSL